MAKALVLDSTLNIDRCVKSENAGNKTTYAHDIIDDIVFDMKMRQLKLRPNSPRAEVRALEPSSYPSSGFPQKETFFERHYFVIMFSAYICAYVVAASLAAGSCHWVVTLCKNYGWL